MNSAAPASFAVCGGGTGGHIFPALAVAAELRRLEPAARVAFLGKADGMEQDLARRAGLPFYGLPVTGLSRSLSPRNLASLWRAARGFGQARGWLKTLQVRAVLGTGGFVCGPVILAAASLKIPSILHESNLVPGLTNRLLAGLAACVALGHEEARSHFPEAKTVVTGFPLRPDLDRPSRGQGCAVFGLDPARRVLFVFPGSLAARRINRAVAEVLPQLIHRLPDLQVLWMTGAADLGLARNLAEKLSLPVVIREFIHEVPEAYAAADLVLARAGAGTLAELSALGKPALLVPYPFATGNHQTYNANILVRAGAAEAVSDTELNGTLLLARLLEIFSRLESLALAAAAVRAVYPRHAAEQLAQKLLALAGPGGQA